MRKIIVATVLALMLVVSAAVPAFALTSADVTIDATPAYVTITNAPGSFDFLTVEAGIDENTGTSNFTITNGSTVNIDIDIVCDGWTDTIDATLPWTYGAAAENTGQLLASDGDGAYDVTVDDTTPAALVTGVTPATSPTWELQLDAPSSFTHGHAQRTTVTVSASPS